MSLLVFGGLVGLFIGCNPPISRVEQANATLDVFAADITSGRLRSACFRIASEEGHMIRTLFGTDCILISDGYPPDQVAGYMRNFANDIRHRHFTTTTSDTVYFEIPQINSQPGYLGVRQTLFGPRIVRGDF